MKKLLLATALLAAAMAPAAYAGYPDTNKPVAHQDNANANGSGGIPSQLYAYYCQTTCSYNSCSTWCF